MAPPGPSQQRDMVRQRANSQCEYCRISEHDSAAATVFETEHIVPKADFSDDDPRLDDPDNLAWACPSCNRHKSNRSQAPDPATDSSTPLFNPRTDSWLAHFSARSSGHIVGLTPSGRATVQALRFNDQVRVAGRLALYQMGHWPTTMPTAL